MSAELLRRAAALMRERAEAVPPDGLQDAWFDADASDLMHLKQYDRDHIASWRPAVALEVANWIKSVAADVDKRDNPRRVGGRYEVLQIPDERAALAVARAFLESGS